MSPSQQIEEFLAGNSFAVVGASTHRWKYGNKVLRCYLQNGHVAYPVNPHADVVEGVQAFPDLAALPELVHGVSIITPPEVTDEIVDQAIELGVHHIWMQPGAESDSAIERAKNAGMNVIHGGPCLLVVLGYDDSWTTS